jgi:hypothetical protein
MSGIRARRAKHRPGCEHCYRVTLLGRDFGTWRSSWEAALEQEANGYATEGQAYRDEHTAPTFKAYLIAMTGQPWPMSGRRPRRYFAA